MPRLPRMKIQPTIFPDQRWLNRRFPDSPFRAPHGYVNSDDPLYIPEEQRVNISELQGPDLPSSITYNRESKWPDRDLARKLMKEELARQAYNRKAAAWNEYIDMPTAERRFWTNRRKLEDAMMDYDLDQDPTWYTKKIEKPGSMDRHSTVDYYTLYEIDKDGDELDDIASGTEKQVLAALEKARAKNPKGLYHIVAIWKEGRHTESEEVWTNRRKLEDAMMDYDLDQDPTWYTKSFENFEHLPTRHRPDYNAGMRRSLNPLDYPESVDFDTFPEDLIEAPWRQ